MPEVRPETLVPNDSLLNGTYTVIGADQDLLVLQDSNGDIYWVTAGAGRSFSRIPDRCCLYVSLRGEDD